MMGAGVLHMVLLPAHATDARGAGFYFGALGAGQILWALLFLRQPDARMNTLGIAVFAVAPFVVYWITRFVRAPFHTGAEAVDVIGIVTKSLEALAVLLLVLDLRPTRGPGFWSKSKPFLVVVALLAGIAVGGASYGAGLAVESVPWLKEGEGASGHSHAEGEASDVAPLPFVPEPRLDPPWNRDVRAHEGRFPGGP